jgi:surfeit locus 1 family protein
LLLPLFVSLGVWQLHRAEEKNTLMQQRAQRQNEPALKTATQGTIEAMRYRRVELAGEFDAAHQFLLDNQIAKQQIGYQVLTPLRIAGSDEAILVNRGWVPAGQDRRQLPDVSIGQTQAYIQGQMDRYPGVGFKLKGAEIPAPGWPSVVQLLDAERLSERLGYRLLPYQVLLAADAPGGYVRDWQQASLHPEKNQGYALQWFSFALVLSVLYVWFAFKPKQPD